MAIRIGNTEIISLSKIKVGNTDVKKVYRGATLIWPPISASGNFVFMSHTSSSTRTISVKLYHQTMFFHEFYASENCVTYTEQHPYDFQAGQNLSVVVDMASGTNSSNGTIFVEAVRDDDVVVASNLYSGVGSGDFQTSINFYPDQGRYYRIYATTREDVCPI